MSHTHVTHLNQSFMSSPRAYILCHTHDIPRQKRTCNTLQHTAPHCTTLHHTGPHCATPHHTATHSYTLQYTATCCNTHQHAATRGNTLHHSAPHCTLHRMATHCTTLQHTATHCNTLQHDTAHCYTLQHTASCCNTLQQVVISMSPVVPRFPITSLFIMSKGNLTDAILDLAWTPKGTSRFISRRYSDLLPRAVISTILCVMSHINESYYIPMSHVTYR